MKSHYTPVFLTKRGELRALRELHPLQKAAITPLVDLNPSAAEHESLDVWAAQQCKAICAAWSKEHAFFVDISRLSPRAKVGDGRYLRTYACELLTSSGLMPIPVLPTDAPPSLMAQLAPVLPGRGVAAAIRVGRSKLAFAEDLPDFVSSFAQNLRVPLSRLALILDLQSIVRLPLAELEDEVEQGLEELKSLGLGQVIVAASSMIESTELKRGESRLVRRLEWALWKQLVRRGHEVAFGDYSVVRPDFIEPDSNARPAAKIRYASEDHWLFLKGGLFYKEPRQYVELAGKAISSGMVRANSMSWGDRRLLEVADGHPKAGNPEQWIAIDSNIHVVHSIDLVMEAVGAPPVVVSD